MGGHHPESWSPGPLAPDGEVYTKWGDVCLPDGTRTPGELFYDQSVQKIIAPHLGLYRRWVKHPRTMHLPWSAGVVLDDDAIPTRPLATRIRRFLWWSPRSSMCEQTTMYADNTIHAPDSTPYGARASPRATGSRTCGPRSLTTSRPAGGYAARTLLRPTLDRLRRPVDLVLRAFDLGRPRQRSVVGTTPVEWAELLPGWRPSRSCGVAEWEEERRRPGIRATTTARKGTWCVPLRGSRSASSRSATRLSCPRCDRTGLPVDGGILTRTLSGTGQAFRSLTARFGLEKLESLRSPSDASPKSQKNLWQQYYIPLVFCKRAMPNGGD